MSWTSTERLTYVQFTSCFLLVTSQHIHDRHEIFWVITSKLGKFFHFYSFCITKIDWIKQKHINRRYKIQYYTRKFWLYRLIWENFIMHVFFMFLWYILFIFIRIFYYVFVLWDESRMILNHSSILCQYAHIKHLPVQSQQWKH